MAARAARRAPWWAWPGKPGPSGRMNFRPSPSLPSSASQQPSSATAGARTVLWGDEFAAKGDAWPTPGTAPSLGNASRPARRGRTREHPGAYVSAQRLRLVRRGRQSLGVACDYFTPRLRDPTPKASCAPRNPRVDHQAETPAGADRFPRRVIKGAGRTCAPRATACATDPPPARADPRTAPPVIWASAACFADRDRRPTPPARLGACAVPHPHPVTQASPPESSSSSVLAGGSDPHDPVPRAADARAGALRDRAVAADGSGRSHLGGPATLRFGTRGRPVVDGLGGRGPLRRRPSPTTEAVSPWRSQGTQVTGRGDQSADMAR